MKCMYVWESVNELTNNWHDGGGLVIISNDLENARELLRQSIPLNKKCQALEIDPDYTASVVAEKDEIFIFPDAGCC